MGPWQTICRIAPLMAGAMAVWSRASAGGPAEAPAKVPPPPSRPAKHVSVVDPAVKMYQAWQQKIDANELLKKSEEERERITKEARSRDRPYIECVTPCWSPDGKLVATNLGIWSVSSDGKLKQIVATEDGVWPVGFTPDGRRYAYLKFAYDHTKRPKVQTKVQPDLCVMDMAGRKERVIAKDVALASWSPKGDRIAYIMPADPAKQLTARWPSTGQLVVADTDGRNAVTLHGEVRLGRRSPAFASQPPVWSPDGCRIAVSEDRAIRIANTDESGSDLVDLTVPPGKYGETYYDFGLMAWADNHTVLAALAYSGTLYMPEYLTRIDVGTGGVEVLSPELATIDLIGGPVWSAAWSPDRRQVAFLHDLSFYAYGRPIYCPPGTDLMAYAHRSGVWTANRDGIRMAQVADLFVGKRRPGLDDLGEPFWSSQQALPSWSPDGKRIAVMYPESPGELHILFLADN